jgi:hypothetical protein
MRLFGLLLLALPLVAAEKRATGESENEIIELTGSVVTERDAIKQMLGSDYGGAIIVVDLRVRPKGDHKITLSRDDFTLRSDRDGQKAQPFAPSQLAGSAVLHVGAVSAGGGTFMGNENGPVYGGIDGRPRRMGGDGGSIGNVSDASMETKVEAGKDHKSNPLLDTLKQKILPEKEISGAAVQGLLYFPMEGKHKPKDLELTYKSTVGKVLMRFKP